MKWLFIYLFLANIFLIMLGSWGNRDKSRVTSGCISDSWIAAQTHYLHVSNTVLEFHQ